jgi:ketosteroid isomerase-like protein
MKRILITTIVSTVVIFTVVVPLQAQPPKSVAMSPNKRTVQKYMDAFARSDHAEVLSCLTDDVEWVIPGMFHKIGKAAFDKEIENEAFVGSPKITVARMTEENDVVVAEGRVRSARKEGGFLNIVFCDVFEMRDAKVKRLTSYLMETKE